MLDFNTLHNKLNDALNTQLTIKNTGFKIGNAFPFFFFFFHGFLNIVFNNKKNQNILRCVVNRKTKAIKDNKIIIKMRIKCFLNCIKSNEFNIR